MTQSNVHYAVQGHSMEFQLESPYDFLLVNTNSILFRTVSKLLQIIGPIFYCRQEGASL